MRFVADESVEAYVVSALRAAGHELLDISMEAAGASDEQVLEIAVARGDVLLTNDKDFGDLVFNQQRPHCGVILMRLHGMAPKERIARMVMLVGLHGSELKDAFTTVMTRTVRIRPRK
jgi:predicted nuclease of predicted toxin-antitoxin system